MYKRMKKGLAFLFAVIFLLTGMPLPAQGAATPAFSKTYLTMYENGKGQGVYKLKVKNVKKGYITRWSISKAGKRYASFDTNRVVAKSKTVTNTLTINSLEESAFSAGLPVCIKVKVYNANKALISQLSFTPTLHRQAESIQLDTSKIENLEQLSVGTKYQFSAAMSPANTTSKLCWQVTDASGKDHSKEITSKGVWTPTEEGKFTITAYAVRKVSKAKLCPTSVEATVGCHINTISQSSANGIRITFGSDVSKRYKDSDFTVKSGESILPVKSLKFSEDGKTAELTTTQNFMNGVTYTVSCNGSEKEFKASMGEPVELAILTTSVQCEKFTTIKYKLLDENGIDVTDNADGSFSYSKNITNGYLDVQTGRVYMNVIGDTGTITMTYTSKDGKIRLTDTKQIVCVEAKAEQAVTTHFTLTNSTQAPLFKDADVRTITIGDTMYAHFQGLDIDDNVISYDSVTYQSSDPDKLIISSDGKITPIKPGNIMVVATAKQGNDSVTYPYSITVREAKYLTSIQMERTYITMSNSPDQDYCVRIPVSAFDQYGNKYTLINEVGTIPLSTNSGVTANYNPDTNCVEIQAPDAASKVYNFTLTITANSRTVSQTFNVYVTVPTGNNITYQAEASPSYMDLSVDENTTESSYDINVRLAKYRNGIFDGYVECETATIQKGTQYYTTDLTPIDLNNHAKELTVTTTSGSGVFKSLEINPLHLTHGTSNAYGTCAKADAGTYQVTLTATSKVTESSGSKTIPVQRTVNINITNLQAAPTYNLRSLTPDRTASNALDLVRSCIQLPDGGNILNCTVTGSTQSGSNYTLHSGEMVHIDKVKVQSVVTIANGERIYVESDILIDKTFTNK